MKKMVKQFALVIFIMGVLMLLFAVFLLLGGGGKGVEVKGFYFIMAIIFTLIGIVGLKNYDRF